MKITVTREHIAKGKRSDGYSCPVSRAISERFPGVDVHVQPTRIWVGCCRYDTPERVREFIDIFDNPRIAKKSLRGFTFELGEPL